MNVIESRAAHGARSVLYGDGAVPRQLRVLLDTGSVDLQAPDGTVVGMLRDFLEFDPVERIGYNGSLQAHVDSEEALGFPHLEPGQIVVTADPDPYFVTHNVLHGTATGTMSTSVVGDHWPHATKLLADAGQSTDPGSDALLGAVADSVGADLLITERRSILGADFLRRFWPGLTIADPSEALLHVTLHARASSTFVVPFGRDEARFSKSTFFLTAAEGLMRSGNDFTRGVRAVAGADDWATNQLMDAFWQRCGRSLGLRDDVWRRSLQREGQDAAEDGLVALDALHLFLMGAADSLARVLDAVAGVNTQRTESVGLQRRDWRKALAEMAPETASAIAADGQGRRAFGVLGRLRNSVHGEGLALVGLSTERDARTGIALSPSDSEKLRRSLGSRTEVGRWGFAEVGQHLIHDDPPMLTDRLLPAVLAYFESIMRVACGEVLEPIPLADPRAGFWRRPPVLDGVVSQLGIST